MKAISSLQVPNVGQLWYDRLDDEWLVIVECRKNTNVVLIFDTDMRYIECGCISLPLSGVEFVCG